MNLVIFLVRRTMSPIATSRCATTALPPNWGMGCGGNSHPYSEQLPDSLGMAAIASLMASYLSHAPSAEKISAGFGEAALGLGEN
jgi:hypothetical protein